jgi:hypothetical protein
LQINSALFEGQLSRRLRGRLPQATAAETVRRNDDFRLSDRFRFTSRFTATIRFMSGSRSNAGASLRPDFFARVRH